jgi:hypothetical protein
VGAVRTSFQVDVLRQSKAESDVKVEMMKYCSSLKYIGSGKSRKYDY